MYGTDSMKSGVPVKNDVDSKKKIQTATLQCCCLEHKEGYVADSLQWMQQRLKDVKVHWLATAAILCGRSGNMCSTQLGKVLVNTVPEDKCMCKLYAHERQAEKTSKLLPKNCHCTETEPKHRTPVDTKATNECTMHVINACTPTQLMHV
jgi:hypothetical protein